MDKILLNRIRTPDGTVLTSYDRHDFRTHRDKLTGEIYMVDGGNEYLRRSLNDVPAEDLTVHLSGNHDKNREAFHWGTRGRHGTEELRRVPLKDLSSAHIKAILETQKQIPSWVRGLFETELTERLNLPEDFFK